MDVPRLPSPTLTFGFVVATLYGGLFHLIFGGGAQRLVYFLGAGWFGFTLGHLGGAWFGLSIFNIGALHFFSATLGALLALGITHVLTHTRSRTRPQR